MSESSRWRVPDGLKSLQVGSLNITLVLDIKSDPVYQILDYKADLELSTESLINVLEWEKKRKWSPSVVSNSLGPHGL